MVTTIKLPVIEFNKSKRRSVFLLIFFISTFVFLGLFIVLNDKNNLIGRLFLISILAFVIGMFFIKKPHTQNGFLIINKDAIEYSTETKTEIFLTREISEISFLYDGYAGKLESLSFTRFSTGCRNVLKFKHKDSEVRFGVKLEYDYLGLVGRVFKEFESKGISVLVSNSSGKKIEL